MPVEDATGGEVDKPTRRTRLVASGRLKYD